MWILTPFGFYSVVRRHEDDDFLTVRARAAGDLDALRERYLPGLAETIVGGGTDYPYRATVSPDAFAAALAKIGGDIDYSNFKDEVAKEQGRARADTYHQVWEILRRVR
jgi:hypothetical protein